MVMRSKPEPFQVWTDDRGEQGFLHGTKAELEPGDLIEPGRKSNYGSRADAAFVYSDQGQELPDAEAAPGHCRGRDDLAQVNPQGATTARRVDQFPSGELDRFPGGGSSFVR